jgi:hypothetical protein
MSKKIKEKKIDPYLNINKKIFALGLDAAELSILICLMSHSFNKTNPLECFPSVDTIRKFSRINGEKCRYILKTLDRAGIIHITERERPRGRTGNLYLLRNWDHIDGCEVDEMHTRLIKSRTEINKELKNQRKERKLKALKIKEASSIIPFKSTVDSLK